MYSLNLKAIFWLIFGHNIPPPNAKMNVWTKFHYNPDSCWDISIKATNANFMVALEKNSKTQQSLCAKLHYNPSSSCWDIAVLFFLNMFFFLIDSVLLGNSIFFYLNFLYQWVWLNAIKIHLFHYNTNGHTTVAQWVISFDHIFL